MASWPRWILAISRGWTRGLDAQAVAVGDDEHDRFGRRNDAADSVRGHIDNPVLRAANLDALEVLLSGDLLR